MSQSDEDPPRKNKDSKKRKNQGPGKNKNKNRKKNMPFIIEMTSGLESFFDNLEQHSKKSSGKGGGGGGGPAEENDEPCEPFENELDYPASGKFEFLDAKLENVDDLIDLSLEFKEGLYNPYTRYNLNLFKVARLVKPLQELKKTSGLITI